MHVYCVGDEDTVHGFRLAGVPGRAVSTPEEASGAVAAAFEPPGACELLIVTEEVARLEPRLTALRLERSRPLVVEIPGPGGPATAAGGESLRRLVQRLVGASREDEP